MSQRCSHDFGTVAEHAWWLWVSCVNRLCHAGAAGRELFLRSTSDFGSWTSCDRVADAEYGRYMIVLVAAVLAPQDVAAEPRRDLSRGRGVLCQTSSC